jgi:uncharacterized protein YndB with AHSA1/START domain
VIRVEVETMIDRPIEEVFDRLVDIDGYSEWLPPSSVFLDSWQTSEGPVALGTTFIDKTRVGLYHGRVTAFRKPTQVNFRMRLRWLGLDVMESRPQYELEPANNGRTEISHVAEGKLYGLFKLLEPYVAIQARRERSRTVQKLKESLEERNRVGRSLP